MAEGFLCSSFSSGFRHNDKAQEQLVEALGRAAQVQRINELELALADSVRFSPCNGPDVDCLNTLEDADTSVDATIPEVRLLFIPTAMYALRPESTRSPGKQRQRARADARARRNDLVALLQARLPCVIHAVTLDLDDGSLKQSSSSDEQHAFPRDGRTALTDWKPHLVYVPGGNTFWLYHCIEKGNWIRDIKELLSSGETVYCGVSAGAIVAGTLVETATWKGWDDPSIIPGRETYDDWRGIRGLELVNFGVFPHYSEEWDDTVQSKIAALDNNKHEIISLGDEEVCHVIGATQSLSIYRND